MHLRTRLLVALGATVSLCLGCGERDVVAPVTELVTLLDAGNEPRTPLRLRLGEGDARYEVRQQNGTHGGLAWEIASHVGRGGGGEPVEASVRISNLHPVEAPGSLTTLPPGTSKLDLTIRGTVDARGRFVERGREARGEADERSDRRLHAGWEDRFALIATKWVIPLPVEPIGLGARWTVPLAVPDSERFPGEAVLELTLVSVDVEAISLGAAIRGKAGPHERTQPFSPTKLRVRSIAVTGEGALRIPAGTFVAEGRLTTQDKTESEGEDGSLTTRTNETSVECTRR